MRETHEMTGSIKGAVSRNSAKLGNNKMPVKLRETLKKTLKTLKERLNNITETTDATDGQN